MNFHSIQNIKESSEIGFMDQPPLPTFCVSSTFVLNLNLNKITEWKCGEMWDVLNCFLEKGDRSWPESVRGQRFSPLLYMIRAWSVWFCVAGGEKARCVLLTAENGLFPGAALRPSHSLPVSLMFIHLSNVPSVTSECEFMQSAWSRWFTCTKNNKQLAHKWLQRLHEHRINLDKSCYKLYLVNRKYHY